MIRAQSRDLRQVQYPTIGALATVALAATVVSAPVMRVTVLALDDDSPYAPAPYKRVSAPPSRPVGHENAGWFQSVVDGSYFEIEPDSGGYITAAQCGDGTAGLLDAMAISSYVRGTPGATYTLTSTLTIPAGRDGHFDLKYSNVVKDTNDPAILVQGVWINERAITSFTTGTEGRTVLNFAEPAPYAQSALLKVISDDSGTDESSPGVPTAAAAIIKQYARGAKAGEFATVKSDPGTAAIGLSHPLLFRDAYVTNPRVAQLTTDGRLRIEINKITLGNPDRSDDIFRLDSAFGVDIDVFSTPFGEVNLARLQSSYDCFVRVRHHAGGPEVGGYGINFQCSENCWGQIDYCGPVRHAGDGGGDPNNSYSDFGKRGLAQNCGLRNTFAVGSLKTPFATHHGTRFHGYINCKSQGAASSGFAFRGQNNYAINCESIDDNAGFGQFDQSSTSGETDSCRFINVRVINPRTRFLSIGDGGALVQDCTFIWDRPASPGALFLLTEDGKELRMVGGETRVKGCVLDALFETSSGTVSVHANRKLIIENFHIDARGLDPATGTVLIINSGVTNVDSLEYRVNNLVVESDDAPEAFRLLSSIVTDTSLFTAGTSFGTINLPPTSSLHQSIPDSVFLPYIKGPIWLGNTAIGGPDRTFRLIMADDTAQSIRFDGVAFVTMTSRETTAPDPTGIYLPRTSPGASASVGVIYQKSATNVDIKTDGTVLTGTTGTDGNFTISPDATGERLYFENRAGSSRTVIVSLGSVYAA